MIDAYLQELKTLLIKPIDFSSTIPEKTLNAAFRHYTLMVIVFTFFFAIITVMSGILSFNSYATHFSTIPVIGWLISGFLMTFSSLVLSWHILSVYLVFLALLIGIFIAGFLLELAVLLIGGEQGPAVTLKTLMYAATPALLLGWIPYIWIIGDLWTIIILILFLEKTQQVSRIQAVAIIILPVVLACILALLGYNVWSAFADVVIQPVLAKGT